MKKLFLVLLISVGLIFALTGCGGTSSKDNSTSEKEVEEETGLAKPVSDVTDGTGLQGTWEETDTEDDTTVTAVLALNSDDTYSFWEGSNSSSADNVESVQDGKYTSTDTQLTLTPEDETGEEQTYDYKLDGNTLTLTNTSDPNDTTTMTRQKS